VARVVIADDDPDIRELLLIKVAHAGHCAIGVADGTAALDELRRSPSDVLVADVSMPGLSGVELCRIVRADAEMANLAIVLVSARTQDSDRAAGMQAGADAYLAKPFSPRQLLDHLKDALAARGR
jgi:DNA-binding response OmpR family regulator